MCFCGGLTTTLASHQLENPRDFGDAPGDSIALFSGKPLVIISAIPERFEGLRTFGWFQWI